jgi:type I restriction enzyme S subunit
VRSVEVLYPPLDEQRRIAAILDQADDLRRKRREALGRLDLLSVAVFRSALGSCATSCAVVPRARKGTPDILAALYLVS